MEIRNGKTWTDREVETLIELFNEGMSDEEIAQRLRRSKEAIKSKRNLIGLNRKEQGNQIKPKNTWTDEEKQILKENYSSMSVKQLSELLNKTEGSIRGMKTVLGLHKRNHPRTDKELDIIKEYYEIHSDDDQLNLKELSEMLGRTPQIISRWAKEMGYTNKHRHKSNLFNFDYLDKPENDIDKIEMRNSAKQALEGLDKNSPSFKSDFMKALWKTEYYQNVIKPQFVERTREQFKANGHPKGMLGKHHTDEVKQRISEFQKEYSASLTQEEKHRRAMLAIETKVKKGTLNNTTSNSYSRCRGGKRQDLNNQYFRSSWEANIARILNFLNIRWIYEYKRFYFSETINGVRSYQPDFYLPEFDIWIEVKGWMDEKSKTRLQLFCQQYPDENNRLFLIDESKYYDLEKDYKWLEYWEEKGSYRKRNSEILDSDVNN